MAKQQNDKARIRSLFIVHIAMLILSLGSSIIYTGVWPYLSQMEPNVSLDEYGFVVAADAFAQMIFSPIFGVIADRMGSIRLVSLICTVTFFGGNVFYATISLIPRGDAKARVWAMLAARFIVGIGTAINAAARAYVSKVTTLKERTTHVALLSLFQTLGFIMGPAMQAALTPLGDHEISEGSGLVFDMYTATGWVSALNGALATVLFLPGIFVEYYSPTSCDWKDRKSGGMGGRQVNFAESSEVVVVQDTIRAIGDDAVSVSSSNSSSSDNDDDKKENGGTAVVAASVDVKSQKPRELLKQYSKVSVLDGNVYRPPKSEIAAAGMADEKPQRPDIIAALVCTFCFFAFFCTFVTLEVLVTPMASDHWGWNEADTILYLGIILAAGGVLSGFTFALIGPLSKRVDERILLMTAGILVMMVGRAVMFPFPGADKPPFRGNYTECGYPDPNITWTTPDPDAFFGGFAQHGSLGGYSSDDFDYDRAAAPGGSIAGCAYCWCLEQPKMTVTQFIIGMAISMVGYPFCTALIASIYSKVLGNRPQGFWMGLLTTSGSIARVVGPIFFTFLYEFYGTYVTFGLLLGVLAVSLVLVLLSYKRLVSKDGVVLENAVMMGGH